MELKWCAQVKDGSPLQGTDCSAASESCDEVIHQQERRQHAQHATLSTSEEAKYFSFRPLRRSPSLRWAMASCLVCGCGTPLTQPARNKPAYVQLKLPRTVSGVQRCAALAGRKSRSGSKRSRNETLSVSCAASPGALSPEDQGDSPCCCCTSCCTRI